MCITPRSKLRKANTDLIKWVPLVRFQCVLCSARLTTYFLKVALMFFLSLQFFTKRLRAVAMLAVFAVSATVHEYALAVSLSFFYPVLFVLFMFFGSECLGIS